MRRTILYIGGTGTISYSCVLRSLEEGWDVTVLNRGKSSVLRPLPEGVHTLVADAFDEGSLRGALNDYLSKNQSGFDVVADFMSFTPEQLQLKLNVFEGHTRQYVFISSASAYQKPVAQLPITESTPLVNPFWQYSRDKASCEDLLMAAIRERNLPATIVRPSHTYDQFLLPNEGGWTDIMRLRQGKPIVVLGDGTSLWTLTHSVDFAYCFVALLGDRRAIGNTFHITGDEVLPWDAIYTELAHAAGVDHPQLVHVSSETIARRIPAWGPGFLGDKAHSVIFDNSKVRSIATGFTQTIPFEIGARQIIEAHDAHPEICTFDPEIDAAEDDLIAQALRG
jgi:nucleoside-diphosphate-sugar epimerase